MKETLVHSGASASIPTEGQSEGGSHTPGPWMEIETETSIDLDDDGHGRLTGWGDIADSNGRVIAVALGYGAWIDPECDANARLIAAAPDLLEALQSIVGQHDKFRQRNGNQEDAYNLLASRWDIFDNARAAIAKATGAAA